MKCPTCSAWSHVKATREKPNYVRRERECANGHRFSGYEITAADLRGSEAARKLGLRIKSCQN